MKLEIMFYEYTRFWALQTDFFSPVANYEYTLNAFYLFIIFTIITAKKYVW